MIIPLVGTCFVIALTLRPKDEGVGIKILHLEFSIFAIGSEISSTVGHFRAGLSWKGWSALLRVGIVWPITYALGLKLRRKAAQLTPTELSSFLCNTVLLG